MHAKKRINYWIQSIISHTHKIYILYKKINPVQAHTYAYGHTLTHTHACMHTRTHTLALLSNLLKGVNFLLWAYTHNNPSNAPLCENVPTAWQCPFYMTMYPLPDSGPEKQSHFLKMTLLTVWKQTHHLKMHPLHENEPTAWKQTYCVTMYPKSENLMHFQAW